MVEFSRLRINGKKGRSLVREKIVKGNMLLSVAGFALATLYLHIQFSLPLLYSVFYHFGFGGMGLAVSFLARRLASIPRYAAWATSFIASIVPVVVRWFGVSGCSLAAFGLVAGASVAVLFACWFEIICSFSRKEVFDLVLGSSIVEPVLRIALIPLGSISNDALFVVISCSSIASMLLMPSENVAQRPYGEASHRKEPCFSFAGGAVAELIFYGAVFGFLHNASADVGSDSFLVAHVLQAVIPFLLLAWIRLRTDRRGFILRVATIAVLLAYFSTIFLGDPRRNAIPISVILICDIASTFFVLMFYRAVETSGNSPAAVFGLGRGIFEISLGIAVVISTSLPIPFVSSISDGLVYLGVVFVVFLLVNRFLLVAQGEMPERLNDEGHVGVDADVASSLAEKCAKIAQEKGISARQAEVMGLICEGKTKAVIAQELFISENTVRWHTKQLYAKFGIHSRGELLDIVERKDIAKRKNPSA